MLCREINLLIIICSNFFFIYQFISAEDSYKDESLAEKKYKTEKIPNVYLIVFKNYYWQNTRRMFLKAALRKQNVIIISFKCI